MGWKFPEIPRPHFVVHLHYLEHFGASEYVEFDKYVLSFMVTFGSIPFSYYSLSSIHNMNVLLDLYNTLTVCIFVLCM